MQSLTRFDLLKVTQARNSVTERRTVSVWPRVQIVARVESLAPRPCAACRRARKRVKRGVNEAPVGMQKASVRILACYRSVRDLLAP